MMMMMMMIIMMTADDNNETMTALTMLVRVQKIMMITMMIRA